MESLTRRMIFVAFFFGCFALVANRYAPISGVDPLVQKKMNTLATETNLLDAVKFGEDIIEKSKRMESAIAGARVKVVKGSISYAQSIDGYSTLSTQKQDYVARTILKATSFILNTYCKPQRISSYECGLYMSHKLVPGSKLLKKCEEIVNVKTFNDEYRRLLPASYHDGIYSFRKSVAGGELPDPRSISSKFHGMFAQTNEDSKHSVALVQWTQFIEHDLAKTTVQTMHDGTDIECCTTEYNDVMPRYLHPACKPLRIASNDSYYQKNHVTCLNYVRSALSVGDTCNFGPANQLNQATNRFDLSQVYGNHESETFPLRSHRGGKLKSQSFDSTEYLPESQDKKLCVANATVDAICYTSGDSRVNINPLITLLHTLFLRSHNRIAKHLAFINPDWDNEVLFQVSRKINIKIYQKIVHEWASTVLGSAVQIIPSNAKEFRVSNEFATAAIRFYNSMMPGEISSQSPKGKFSSVDLEDIFYKPKDLRKKEYFNHLVSSVLLQNAMSLDTSYVDDMAHLLFKTNNVGTDVLALDIQRGRDHGLSSFTNYYKHCTGTTISTWEDLSTVMNPSDLDKLKKAYSAVQDVDLIVGAIAEIPTIPGALVGKTLSCIIRDQISHSFSEHQSELDPILANYSAARFLCDTAQVLQVQQNIFRLPSVDNPPVPCSQLPTLDLSTLRQALHL